MVRIQIREDDFAPNLYDRLGVNSDATDDEIKSAYKSKAQKTHPDRFPDKEAEFVAVGRAYEVLSSIRSVYDSQLNSRSYCTRPSDQKTQDFNSSAKKNDYTDEDVQRYKDAEERFSAGNPKSGDLSTVFNFVSGSGKGPKKQLGLDNGVVKLPGDVVKLPGNDF